MSVAATTEFYAPSIIGPYRVLHEIGRGGMGVVYRAVRVDGGPEVALKMPSSEMSFLFGSIRREIHALSRLDHPGVVRIVDQGTEKGVPWYAMELLDACTSVDALLQINPSFDASRALSVTDIILPFAAPPVPAARRVGAALPEVRSDLKRALTLMYRLARVLAYVHAHGIVHRDLKPENVLVRPGDRPVLVDFGLMGHFRAQSGRETLEIGGVGLGTALYAAPEQSSGQLADARADLYSFGAMLYEIVTGGPPFDGYSVQDVVMMHLMDLPVPPSERVRGVPPVLERLILNLLEKRRADRLGYAEDVAELLVEAGAEPDPDFKVETAAYLYRPEIVGRKQTIDALCNRLPDIRKGRGNVVMLGGVSGIGKTSVAAAFGREATLGQFEVIAAECDPVGGQPLHPLRPLLRHIADYCRGNPKRIEQILGDRIFVLREHEPSLDALVTEYAPRVAPEIASRRLFSDLGGTLAAFARQVRLVLILDDLQWADEITLRFLASLKREFFDDVPLMILGTYRIDEAGPELRAVLEQDHVGQLVLGRLDDRSVADIVRSMLAAPDASLSFLQFLAAQTEGNPFFIAEYLRVAVEEQLLFRKQGRWHVASADDSYAKLALPRTIRDLVAVRLGRLSPAARRLAEAAAVLGRETPQALLVATSGETESEALEAINELLERHVFEPVDDGVRFAHDKLREGAYAGIEPERQRTLHARAAEVIEHACQADEQLTRHAAEIGRHWDAAGRAQKAIEYYDRAADYVRLSGACHEAIGLLIRAFELDGTVDQPHEERALRQARRYRIASHAHYDAGDLPKSRDSARRSLATAGVQLPGSSRGWRLRLLKETALQAAHLALPRRLLRVRPARQSVLQEVALAAHLFSIGSFFEADKSMMLVTGLMAVNSAERCADVYIVPRTYAELGLAATMIGLHGLADRYLEEGRRGAVAKNDPFDFAHVAMVASAAAAIKCDWPRAFAQADDALSAAQTSQDDPLIEMSMFNRHNAEYYTGGLAKALETSELARVSACKRSGHQHEVFANFGCARSLILMGEPEKALASMEAAAVYAPELDCMALVIARGHHAEALLYCGKLDEAVEVADAVVALAAEAGMIMGQMYRGLAGANEVYFEACGRGHGGADNVARMRRAIHSNLRHLRGLARRQPLSMAITLRQMARAECLDGNRLRGERLFRRALATAVQKRMPIEEGIASFELSRLVSDPTEASTLRERAVAIFRATGCILYLRKMGLRP